MNRRRYLAISSVALGSLSGCTGDPSGIISDDNTPSNSGPSGTNSEPPEPNDSDSTNGSGSESDSDTRSTAGDEAVVANIRYEPQNVIVQYSYNGDEATEETTPTEVIYHTGESPTDGSVIYEVEDPQSSVSEEFGFREDFNVSQRDDLPTTRITATYPDGSTEVLAEQSPDGVVASYTADINVDRDLKTGETTITAASFNSDYITLQDGAGNVVGRIDEPGGSITLSAEEAYIVKEGNDLLNQEVFRVAAHVGDQQNYLETVRGGFPEPTYESVEVSNNRILTDFALDGYDELRVSGNAMAVGTDDPNAELSEQSVVISEATSVIAEGPIVVEVETEAGYTVNFFPSPGPDRR